MTEEKFEEIALADDLTAYVNDKHTQEECIGFIDGYKAALAKLKNLRLDDVGGLPYFIKHKTPILVGFAIGTTLSIVFNLIENIIVKIALIIYGG